MSRRLILGAAGSVSAFGTLESVRARWGDAVFVVAIDTNPRELVAASLLADAFVRVPPARTPAYPAALAALAASYPGSDYLPLHDDEIEVAAGLAAAGRLPPGLRLIAPPRGAVRICCDKWEMHRWLRAHGLPSPETALAAPEALGALRLPAILKPREGTGGGSFRTIGTASDLAGVDPAQWLLQEELVKPHLGIEVFLGRNDGVFRCICREFIERRPGGPSTKARLYEDPVVAEIAERLARELPLPGASNFEMMTGRDGNWRVIDVNPRVSAGTSMCRPLGIDIFAANLADFWGEPTADLLPPLRGEHYVVRQYVDRVLRPEGDRRAE